ncbi:MAG: PspA/IM30 family protein [Kofleriaceae bacterium]|jgi:phage shock protein A|nr:PspA/IM30 family protein [Kofleriaceae bacterium]
MGFFSRLKGGISSSANAALDKAIDPAKEIDMAILELEEQRKKALAELVSYKATAKQMEQDIERQRARAEEWEKRAMNAVRAGNDEAAKEALRQHKACLVEVGKIQRDRDEATGYAVQLNKSRKEFEVKLQTLKLRKGTLATQLAAARAGGDQFGNDTSVWDKFKAAEDRIDAEAIESEVDSAMRGEELASAEFDQKLLAAAGGDVAALGAGAGPTADRELAAMKEKVAAQRAAKDKQLAAGAAPAEAGPGRTGSSTGGTGDGDGS